MNSPANFYSVTIPNQPTIQTIWLSFICGTWKTYFKKSLPYVWIMKVNGNQKFSFKILSCLAKRKKVIGLERC